MYMYIISKTLRNVFFYIFVISFWLQLLEKCFGEAGIIYSKGLHWLHFVLS